MPQGSTIASVVFVAYVTDHIILTILAYINKSPDAMNKDCILVVTDPGGVV